MEAKSLASDTWTVVGGIATLVAAVAALVTIAIAYATVREARLTQREARAAHEQEVAEQRRALEASAAAHKEEMRERRQALAEEMRIQRIAQCERVAEVVMHLADTARDELVSPPPSIGPGLSVTLIPATLMRLSVAVILLRLLGGPEVHSAQALAGRGYPSSEGAQVIASAAWNLLQEIEALARNDASLKPIEGE